MYLGKNVTLHGPQTYNDGKNAAHERLPEIPLDRSGRGRPPFVFRNGRAYWRGRALFRDGAGSKVALLESVSVEYPHWTGPFPNRFRVHATQINHRFRDRSIPFRIVSKNLAFCLVDLPTYVETKASLAAAMGDAERLKMARLWGIVIGWKLQNWPEGFDPKTAAIIAERCARALEESRS